MRRWPWTRTRHVVPAHTPSGPALGEIARPAFDYRTYVTAVPRSDHAAGSGHTMLAAAHLVGSGGSFDAPQLQAWQIEAWDYMDSIPELSFAARRTGNALSRVRLYVGVRDPGGEGRPDPLPDNEDETTDNNRDVDLRAREPLEALFGGQHGGLMSRLGTHLTVPGDSYVVGYTDPQTKEPAWYVASNSELTTMGAQGAELNRDGMSDRVRIVPAGQAGAAAGAGSVPGMVLRLWRPHARYGWQADSPVRALRGNLKELGRVTAHIGASLESRLAGAGMLFIPQSATLPAPTRGPDGKQSHADNTMATLIDAMLTPLRNPNSAAALVPLIARVRDDAIGKIQHLKFSTPLDERVLALRESALRQLAIGLDMPPEVMLGLGESSNHWNAWLVTEDEIKLTIAPLCEVICAALTEKYLWPRLRKMGIENPQRYVIYFDTTELSNRPNRAPDAQALYALGLLSDNATRRESGFGDDDKPSDDEALRYLLVKLMTGNVAFEQARPWLQLLNVDTSAIPTQPGPVDAPDTQTRQPDDEAAADAPQDPGVPDTAGNPSNPAQPAVAPAALAADARLALVGAAHGTPR